LYTPAAIRKETGGETEETMNSDPREKTKFLAGKLRRVRDALGLSQTELLNLLGLTAYYHHTRISLWERGYREPPIKVLLKYARAAGVSTDVLIDDDLDLPKKLSPASAPKKKAAGKKAPRGRKS
jgi:transcriptional regulator with XRE-family HTH domain